MRTVDLTGDRGQEPVIPAHRDVLPDSAKWRNGVLWVGDLEVPLLVAEFGTPLYIYDEQTLRSAARDCRSAFAPLQARVSYASKACALIGVLRVFHDEGLDLDVVSGGELEAGLRAGFEPGQIHLHGNFKSETELTMAASRNLHAVVVDNFEELERLARVARGLGVSARVTVRVRLAVEARTHPYLQTSGAASKFGISLDALDSAWSQVRRAGSLRLTGIQAHIGSQIREAAVFADAAREMVARAEGLERLGAHIGEVGVGGGWAVGYLPGEPSLPPAAVAEAIAPAFSAGSRYRPAVEPGRALVARSAIAVYRVGSVKTGGSGRIIAVDGGMGDNPRPALYGAAYQVLPVAGRNAPASGPADVVGRYCESGDILARGVDLPLVEPGDLLCMPVSGAYQLSMASAYNLVPHPAAVMVNAGDARLLLRRGSVEQILSSQLA